MEKIDLALKNVLPNQTIWKYFDLPSFIYLLLNQKLIFRRFDKFADKLEGTMPQSAQEDYQKFLEKMLPPDEVHQRVITERECINRYKFWAYANSWSIDDDENYALWKIYLENNKCGIAIKSTIQDLSDSIIYDSSEIKNKEDIFIREVSYDKLGYNNTNQETVFTNKYPYYRYESELRLFFKNQRNFNKKDEDISKGYNDEEVKLIRINLSSLMKEVFISPFAGKWIKDTIHDLLQKKFTDFDIKFGESKILV